MILSGGSRIKRMPLVHNRRWSIVVIIAAGALLVLTAGFFAWKYFNISDSDEATTQKIMTKVNQLYLTPEGEEPVVARIQNKTALKDRAFFDNSQNGDYLLVYEGAQIALIYRESLDKLINVGPTKNDQEGQAGAETAEIPTEP
jgi:hypothetical protein